jgi:crescentin
LEATVARNNAEDLETARGALSERKTALTKTLKTRETALTRAEEKIASLTERNAHLERDVQISRTNIEKRVEELHAALQHERMERAVVEGALKAARKDNSRLQQEVAGLRLMRRHRTPLEEASATSKDTESFDTISSAKRGKGAEPAAAVGSNKA